MDTDKKTCELTRYEYDLIRESAWKLSHSRGYTVHDVPDIEQELALELIRRLPKFNPAKARRTTFASMVVRNRIRNMVRDRKAEMRDVERKGPSLNQLVQTKEGEEIELIENVAQDDMDRFQGNRTRGTDEIAVMRIDMADALAHLPEPLRQAADLLSRMSASDASVAVGMPVSTFRKTRVLPLRAALAHLEPYIREGFVSKFVSAG